MSNDKTSVLVVKATLVNNDYLKQLQDTQRSAFELDNALGVLDACEIVPLVQGLRDEIEDLKHKLNVLSSALVKADEALGAGLIDALINVPDVTLSSMALALQCARSWSKRDPDDEEGDCPYPKLHARDCTCRGAGGER